MGLRLNSKDECEDAFLHILSKLEMCDMVLSDSQKIAYLFCGLGPILVPLKALSMQGKLSYSVRGKGYMKALPCSKLIKCFRCGETGHMVRE